jgi:hypothetical protein
MQALWAQKKAANERLKGKTTGFAHNATATTRAVRKADREAKKVGVGTSSTVSRANHLTEAIKRHGVVESTVRKTSCRGKTQAMLGDVQKLYAELTTMKNSVDR